MSTCVSEAVARRIPPRGVRAIAVLVLTLAAMCAAGAGAAQAVVPRCPQLADFNTAGFSNPTAITNGTFPLVPGTQLTLEGTVVRGGVPVQHRVVFTVTDLTKVIAGVRTLVIWDVDSEGGTVLEAELSFFAQDDAGNVWNFGEYPEEFLDGTFIGAPSVWIAGIKEAQPGIHMSPTPKVSRTFFLLGFAPDIEFEDCGRVAQVGQHTCVPFGCFDNVVVTRELDRFDPEGGESIVTAHPERWGDAVVVRKDIPTSYHLSVVADDALQRVTHVVRGTDLEAATDLHVLLQRLLELPTPLYHHHALIRDVRGDKLSKSLGSESLRELRSRGVTPTEIRTMLGFGPPARSSRQAR